MPPFDPNSAAAPGSGIFGLPFNEDESALVLFPVPWEATTSFGGGTAEGPAAILDASHQVDLAHARLVRPYEAGLFLRAESTDVRHAAEQAKEMASGVIEAGGAGDDPNLAEAAERVNALSEWMNGWVEGEAASIFAAGRIPGLVGGDHSTPLGAWKAAAKATGGFDLLQIDAHMDLRKAFEGFHYSHASITYNGLEEIAAIRRCVQVGIRDFCDEERDYAEAHTGRVSVFYQWMLDNAAFAGEPWGAKAGRIVEQLGDNVWITFDIDGLDPALCPHTGTPVPGGLSFAQAVSLIEAVALSGRRIIGFDLNEVSPGPDGGAGWDANVGARVLWNLCCWTLHSQGKAALRG
ncbi:MAG: agmatinase family protein [Candidatus Sumerlaeia bacterium]|nr:agmatinase family protein [Candidatus Sumerlaeia bacterium]